MYYVCVECTSKVATRNYRPDTPPPWERKALFFYIIVNIIIRTIYRIIIFAVVYLYPYGTAHLRTMNIQSLMVYGQIARNRTWKCTYFFLVRGRDLWNNICTSAIILVFKFECRYSRLVLNTPSKYYVNRVSVTFYFFLNSYIQDRCTYPATTHFK